MTFTEPARIRYRRDIWQLLTTQKDSGTLGGAAELGVAEGNFAEEILDWPIAFPFVYLVDRWHSVLGAKGDSSQPQIWHDRNRLKAEMRVQRFGSRARILAMESADAARLVTNDTLHFVNVDADHSYLGVTVDLLSWWPKLKRGGVIAFHDHENPAYGVKRAVAEFALANHLPVFLLPEDKEEDAGAFLIKP